MQLKIARLPPCSLGRVTEQGGPAEAQQEGVEREDEGRRAPAEPLLHSATNDSRVDRK